MTSYTLNVGELNISILDESATTSLDFNSDVLTISILEEPITFERGLSFNELNLSIVFESGTTASYSLVTTSPLMIHIILISNLTHEIGYMMDAPLEERLITTYRIGGKLIDDSAYSGNRKVPFKARQSLIIPISSDLDEQSKYYYSRR